MPETNIPVPGTLPNQYEQVLYWKITEKPARAIALNVAGSLLFVVFAVIFFGLAVRLGKLPATFSLGPGELALVITALCLTLLLHELTHGLAMRMFGARPRYGILWKQLMFYATSPGYAFPRHRFIIIALAPFIFISLGFILAIWLLKGTGWVALPALCGAINAGGAVGDLWITAITLRYPAHAYIVDEQDGVRVFLPAPAKEIQEQSLLSSEEAL